MLLSHSISRSIRYPFVTNEPKTVYNGGLFILIGFLFCPVIDSVLDIVHRGFYPQSRYLEKKERKRERKKEMSKTETA